MHPEPTLPLLPARSRLYSLLPYGLGTERVESLTGYLTRLAKAHRVSVGVLLKKEILQYLDRHDPGSRISLSPDSLRSINGLDAVAATFSRVLERLTCRDDLQFLTMITWADVLSSRGLLRRTRAWCPACYEEDAEPYEHLLWCLEPASVCSHHARSLETRCPHCRLRLPVISWRSVPGFCSSCRSWLGFSSRRHNTSADVHGTTTAMPNCKTAENLGEMLASAPRLKNPPGRGRIIYSLVSLIGTTDVGSLARRLDIDYVTAWTWSTGGVRLLVNRLLSICARLDVSIVEFFTSEEFAPRSTDAERPLVPATAAVITGQVLQTRRERTAIYRDAKRHLRRTIKLEPSPPPSLKSVCRKGGFSLSYVYRVFPELGRAITNRRKVWSQQRRSDRHERLTGEVRDVTLRLHSEGINPTTLNVARALSKPGAIRDPMASAALREVRHKLGLE